MSLLEILIYVAILAVIGTVLSGYFIAAVSAQTEHDRRNDLDGSLLTVVAQLRMDALRATQLVAPPPGASSTLLRMMTLDGDVSYQKVGSGVMRGLGTTTLLLTSPNVNVRELWFTAAAYVEPRLLSTTTSVTYHVLLEHVREQGMTRGVDGTLLLGKDAL